MTVWCCNKDEGRSLKIGVQALVLIHLKRLWSKATVVSVEEKMHLMHQEGVKKMNKTELSLSRRESVNGVKTSERALCWDKFSGHLVTELNDIRRGDSMILTQALLRNAGTFGSDVKGEAQADETVRDRVPMPSKGSEQPIVVMKSVKADGAKGLRCSGVVVGQLLLAGGANE